MESNQTFSCGQAASVRACTSSAEMPPSGWGITTTGKFSTPIDCASKRASGRNLSVQMVRVGTPRRSNSIVSWTLHDVHAPQSPVPFTTNPQSAPIRSNSSSPAPTAEFAFS